MSTPTYMEIISDLNLDWEEYYEIAIHNPPNAPELPPMWKKQNRKIKIYHVDQLHGLAFIGIKHFEGGPELYAAYKYEKEINDFPELRPGYYLLQKHNRKFYTGNIQKKYQLSDYERQILSDFVHTFTDKEKLDEVKKILGSSPKAELRPK